MCHLRLKFEYLVYDESVINAPPYDEIPRQERLWMDHKKWLLDEEPDRVQEIKFATEAIAYWDSLLVKYRHGLVRRMAEVDPVKFRKLAEQHGTPEYQMRRPREPNLIEMSIPEEVLRDPDDREISRPEHEPNDNI